jgi:hypothetical protein
MGRATPTPAPEYRDDPDAVSLHTTPDDYTYDDAPEITGLPPSYADSQGDSVDEPAAVVIRHILPPSNRMNHGNYTLKMGKPVVNETQTLMDARYDSDAVYLEEGIRQFAKEPPWPLVYVLGTHSETVRKGDKKETKAITDFRIVMNLRNYLMSIDRNEHRWAPMRLETAGNGEKTHRGTIWKQRAPGFKQDIEVGSTRPTLKKWCHRYCASPRMLRIFRLRRVVTGFDDELLKNRIEGLIRSTNYRGHISVTFSTEDKNVDIYTTNFVNKWRLQQWVCWIFYLTFLWIFTWPYLYFATKRYAVVRAEWPFSVSDTHGNKTYTTLSEEQWFEKWHVAIRRLVLDRFEGEASDAMMSGVLARPADPPMPGTIQTGHEGIDNAVGMLTQGFQIARSISSGNIGRTTQTGWGYDN